MEHKGKGFKNGDQKAIKVRNFFHKMVDARVKSNSIGNMLIEGKRVEDLKVIENHVESFYKDLYSEEVRNSMELGFG